MNMRMIENIRALGAALVVAVLLCGCQNNGHIGTIFGSWSLDFVVIDGEEQPFPAGLEAAVMSFQGTVVRFSSVEEFEEASRTMCSWSRQGDILTFNFENSDNMSPIGQGSYARPAWMHFDKLVEDVTITQLDNSTFRFMRTDGDGKEYQYKFSRTW